MMRIALIISAAVALGSSAWAGTTPQYWPEYAGPDGGIVRFSKTGFYITYFDDEGDYSYSCKKLDSLTTSLHWAQCTGGDKFLFTFDPKHPETMKIGDVVYKACGKLRDQC